MKSLDTSVLARFFIDDPDDEQAAEQRPAAIRALAERCFVAATVLLELEWVMRGFYRLPRAEFIRVAQALAGAEHVSLEDRDIVLAAVEAHGRGLDFADALHHARSGKASGFVTFDQRLAKRAATLGITPPVEALG